jgi:predicted acyltransferase
MLLVNFLGGFAVCPKVLRHSHDYLSYADTVMPQFLFAVGFAMRLTFGRRVQGQGAGSAASAYGRMVQRLLGLVLVSLIIYQVSPRAANWTQLTEKGFWGVLNEPLKRTWFQTLMHIAVTSLWILPVVGKPAGVRILWMLLSGAAHVFLSYRFNFVWVNTNPNAIDGGPLGFLTWSIPAIVGTLACDSIVSAPARTKWPRLLISAALLMALGYLLSCGTRLYDVPEADVASLRKEKLAAEPVIPTREQVDQYFQRSSAREFLAEPPFVPPPDEAHRKWNYWMMSQRGGTLSYLTFSAGFSLAVYLLFHLITDCWGWQLPFFRTFGTNALAAYVLHDLVDRAVSPFVPKDSPAWYVSAAVLTFFAIVWLFVRHFEKRGIYLRA